MADLAHREAERRSGEWRNGVRRRGSEGASDIFFPKGPCFAAKSASKLRNFRINPQARAERQAASRRSEELSRAELTGATSSDMWGCGVLCLGFAAYRDCVASPRGHLAPPGNGEFLPRTGSSGLRPRSPLILWDSRVESMVDSRNQRWRSDRIRWTWV